MLDKAPLELKWFCVQPFDLPFSKMAPSQLKQLRTSLRDQGLVGPSRSKKQKKQSANGRNDDARRKAQRNAALESIRDSFNPFEVKVPARKAKFDVTSSQNVGKPLQRKPGVTKGLGEERVSKSFAYRGTY